MTLLLGFKVRAVAVVVALAPIGLRNSQNVGHMGMTFHVAHVLALAGGIGNLGGYRVRRVDGVLLPARQNKVYLEGSGGHLCLRVQCCVGE